MSKSNSDPLSEGKLWGNLSPKSRLKAYMPEKRKTIYTAEHFKRNKTN